MLIMSHDSTYTKYHLLALCMSMSCTVYWHYVCEKTMFTRYHLLTQCMSMSCTVYWHYVCEKTMYAMHCIESKIIC